MLGAVAVLLAAGIGATFALAGGSPTAASSTDAARPTPSNASTGSPISTPTPTVTAGPGEVVVNGVAYNIDDPNSIQVVVNKQRPLNPQDFAPSDLVDVNVPHTWAPQLRQEAATALETMFAAASSEAGLTLASNSAYRSYSSQQSIYDGNDALTARPGFSEHQTGLAIDIGADSGKCSLAACFGTTAEGEWLAANAYRFGFIMSYPDGLDAITGFEYEPWHFRYIGTTLSNYMHDHGIRTIEELFGLPAAPSY